MMQKDELRKVVIAAMSDLDHLRGVKIEDQHSLADLGLDSLDRMNILLEVEKAAGFRFKDEEVPDPLSIDSLYKAYMNLKS